MTAFAKLKAALATAEGDLTSKRERIASIAADLAGLDLAGVDRSEIERRVDSAIADAARAGLPASGLAEPQEQAWRVHFNRFGSENPFQLFAVLAPDRLRAALLAGAPEGGISSGERAEKRGALETEQFELEVAEEVLIRSIESIGGAQVPRREDANPAIVVAPDAELEAS
ncbi:hypothetical protein AB4Z40_31995 [Bosea sp. 2YAB26]|uniref:hypothetical protein n=1 Tax=Bosea sp. 2YAB26 TaxID=3237478 RepID=UPI003F8E8CFB